MRVFIDTNILISCIVWPESKPAKAFFKAAYMNEAILCEYSIEEIYRVFSRKFPDYVSEMRNFLAKQMTVLKVVSVPDEPYEEKQLIRDENDRPILRAAINAGADVLLTGDKDFLESGITNPRILSASGFLELA